MSTMKKTRRTSKTTSEPKFKPVTWNEAESGLGEKAVPPPQPAVPAKSKYAPPSNHPIFVARWNDYIGDISKRDNFKPGHLSQLKVLCDLYVQYDKLSRFLDSKDSLSYESQGRNGMQLKLYPEVQQKNRVEASIRDYSKMLGLLLVKDADFGDAGEPEDEWD